MMLPCVVQRRKQIVDDVNKNQKSSRLK